MEVEQAGLQLVHYKGMLHHHANASSKFFFCKLATITIFELKYDFESFKSGDGSLSSFWLCEKLKYYQFSVKISLYVF